MSMTPGKIMFALLRKLRIGPGFVALPLVFAFCAALLEGISTGLLIPLLKGLVEGDFGFIWQSSIGVAAREIYPAFETYSSLESFSLVLGTIFLGSVLRIAFGFISDILSARRMREFADRLRNLAFSSLIGYGKAFFDQSKQGELHNTMLVFTKEIGYRMQRVHVQLRWLMILSVYIVMLLYINWQMTVALILVIPFYHYPVSWIVRRIRSDSKKYAYAERDISSLLQNILSTVSLIKVSRQEEQERERFARESLNVSHSGMAIDQREYSIGPLHELISLLLIVGVALAIAFLVLNEPDTDVSSYLVFLYLLKRSSTAFGTIADLRGAMASMQGQLTAVWELIEPAGKFTVHGGNKPFPGLKSKIEIKHLQFSYSDDREVLRDLSFTIEKGGITALVGPSGAGKSTIGNILVRLYDCAENQIYVDGTDIREFELYSFLKHVAVVNQDVQLFNDSLKNNILYGLEVEVADSELQKVIHSARLESVVEKLSDGLDTIVGDRGVQLSGGEKQRVAIARAMLRDPEILLLDEATSALDAQTEQQVQEALDHLVVGKTVLVIAHRFSTLRNAEKIITVENGKIVESGSYAELVEAGGTFSELLNAQKGFY